MLTRFQRGVDGDVCNGGEQSERSGERIDEDGEIERAEECCEEAHDQAMREADASGGHGAILGAAHEAIGFALEGLVERAGAAGDDRDACERLEHPEIEGADAGAQAAQVKARRGGDDDHDRDAQLEERGVVCEQAGACGWDGGAATCPLMESGAVVAGVIAVRATVFRIRVRAGEMPYPRNRLSGFAR